MFKVWIASALLSASLLAGEISVAVAANLSDVIEVFKAEFAKSADTTNIDISFFIQITS